MEPSVFSLLAQQRARLEPGARAFFARSAELSARLSARHTSLIAVITLLFALSLTVGVAYSFARGQLGPWSAALLIAAACSAGRKVERELRDNAVYPRLPALRHTLLALGWLMRPYDPNPWLRIELRALGLGGAQKLTIARIAERFVLVHGPLTWLYVGTACWSLMLFSREQQQSLTAGMEQALPLAQWLAVVWLLPSVLLALQTGATRLWRALGGSAQLTHALASLELRSRASTRLLTALRRVRESFPGVRA